MFNYEQWDRFEGRLWKEEINTRDFIQKNYTPYDGDASFLAGPTEATDKLWGILQGLQKEERAKGGVLDMDTDIVSGITSHGPGYISEETKDLEQIVGLQTDKPLKRSCLMVVSVWQRKLARTMATSQAQSFTRSSLSTAEPITRAYLMLTLQR